MRYVTGRVVIITAAEANTIWEEQKVPYLGWARGAQMGNPRDFEWEHC